MPRMASTAARSSSTRTSPAARISQRPAETLAARLDLDVAELAAHLRGDVDLAVLLGQRERLVQHRGALLVAAADGVDHRHAERGERAGQQRRIADRARLGDAVAQAGQPRLDRAGVERGAPGLELPERRRAVAHGRRPGGAVLLRGAARCAGRAPGRAPARNSASHASACARAAAASPAARQAADEQLVRVLVVRGGAEHARGERRAVERPAGGERRVRRVAQHRLAGAGEPAALHQQPGLEDRAGVGLDALEQLAARERRIGSAAGRARGRRPTRPAGAPSASGSPAQRVRGAERAAQLRERPAQRAERVVGAAEDQLGQPGARDGPLGQREVGEHRPRLAAARRGRRRAVAQDRRAAEQPDLEPGAHQGAGA